MLVKNSSNYTNITSFIKEHRRKRNEECIKQHKINPLGPTPKTMDFIRKAFIEKTNPFRSQLFSYFWRGKSSTKH